MADPIAAERFRAAADAAGLSSSFEALFDAAPSPFLVVTPPDYTIIAVNDEYLRATMTERAAILGRGLFDVFPDNPDAPSVEGPPELRASLARVLAERRTDDMPVVRYDIPRTATRGGGFEERWWSPRNAPVLDRDGNVICIIHHVVDVTARIRAEAALRASEEKFRTLFESIDEGFCIVEMRFDEAGKAVDFRFLEVNPAFEPQTGIANAAGRWMREILPGHEEYWFQTFGRVAKTGEPVRFQNRAGELGRTYDVYSFRVGDPEDRHVAILFDDVTARVRGEAALRESAQQLRAAVGERDALLKEVHHRVKNNLQVITSLLEMQARQTADRRALSSLVEARNRLTAIAAIHELLYQSGTFSEVDVTAYARRLLAHVNSLYDGRSRIDASVDGDGVTIDLARAVPFGLLLNELLSNAYKHAFPRTGGQLHVMLSERDGQLWLNVTDTGVGLPVGYADHPGALGLQLVHMLTKQLGGTVTFDSAAGTSVNVRLPIQRPSESG